MAKNYADMSEAEKVEWTASLKECEGRMSVQEIESLSTIFGSVSDTLGRLNEILDETKDGELAPMAIREGLQCLTRAVQALAGGMRHVLADISTLPRISAIGVGGGELKEVISEGKSYTADEWNEHARQRSEELNRPR
jgi:hypothetical protein